MKAPQSLHEFIRLEAYLLSERAGHPQGMDDYFWAHAEKVVLEREAALKGAVKKVKAAPKGKLTATKAKATVAKKAPVTKPAAKTAKKTAATVASEPENTAAPAAPAPEAPAPKKVKPAGKATKNKK